MVNIMDRMDKERRLAWRISWIACIKNIRGRDDVLGRHGRRRHMVKDTMDGWMDVWMEGWMNG